MTLAAMRDWYADGNLLSATCMKILTARRCGLCAVVLDLAVNPAICSSMTRQGQGA